ncbi:M48 family metallopeptidase [Oscillospiraceae bacterium CM]|nr:M48 family metallopeptidase [Oscillospiraceae bacterium CM]
MTADYTVIYSKRKTLALEITKDAALLVRAPLHAAPRDIDAMLTRHARWIQTGLAAQRHRLLARPPLTGDEIVLLKNQAIKHIPARVAFYASIMGLVPTAVKITSAEKRFGSCSGTNHLCFSWRLMRYPADAIDYVVVHELAHIRHKNHGKAFYALIGSVLPDFKRRKKLLGE